MLARDLRIALAVAPGRVGEPGANLSSTRALAREAARLGARIVCFPELHLTGYSTRPDTPVTPVAFPGPVPDSLAELARNLDMVILAGAALPGTRGKAVPAHLAAFPDGKVHAARKVHLNPVEREAFEPGDSIVLFNGPGFSFGVQMCYDAHFPELSTRMALGGADILFLPHASPRGNPEEKEKSWLRHLTARAWDNAVYVAAVNPCGDNGAGLEYPGLALVLGPDGTVLARKTDGAGGLLVADLSAERLAAQRAHPMRYFLPQRNPGACAVLEILRWEESGQGGEA
jgi:N-carbamoylputrescine amidase